MNTTTAERPALLAWMRENLEGIPKDLLYRQSAIDQMCFFRDRIAFMFRPDSEDVDERMMFCKIDGWHWSKSVHLPVYYFKTDHVEVVARGNFYNWNVTVVADRKIELPFYFGVDVDSDYLFMEGMENWRRKRFADDQKEFSFCVGNDYKLFAIMWCIRSQVVGEML